MRVTFLHVNKLSRLDLLICQAQNRIFGKDIANRVTSGVVGWGEEG